MTQRYKPKEPDKDKVLVAAMKRLAKKHPRYGYRFITAKLSLAVHGRMVTLSRFMGGFVMSFWTVSCFTASRRRRCLRKAGGWNTMTIGRTAAWGIRPRPSSPPRVLLRSRLRLDLSNTRHRT